MRRIAWTVTAGLLLLAAMIAPAAAGAAGMPRVKVVASGLNSPKHLLYTARGVYVVESGTGGPVSASCVTAPATEGPGTTQYCEGPTGAIALIGRHGTQMVLGKLPSVVAEDTQEALGPSAVSVSQRGRLAVTFQDELVNQNGTNNLPGAARRVFGTFRISRYVSVDIARYAAEHPQNPLTFGGTPGETTYDSDPYAVTPYRGGYAVTDAAANSLLWVTSQGHIRLLARFPTVAEQVPPGVFGPVAVPVNAQAVPTSVAVGPDGALYVGLLRGVPSTPGTADVYRVVPGRAPTIWAQGLTAVTAITFDGKGRLLATELSTGGLLAAPKVPGALVRISAGGGRVITLPVSGLTEPTGVAVAPNGAVYVANNGTSAGTASPSGEVLKITGLG